MRRARRIAARIAVFALIGAAATVLVAWGMAPSWESARGWRRLNGVPFNYGGIELWERWGRGWRICEADYVGLWSTETELFERWPERRDRVNWAKAADALREQSELLRRSRALVRLDAANESPYVEVQARGWPRYAMVMEKLAMDGSRVHSAITLEAIGGPHRHIPLRPLWPGFAVDTAFYGGLAFLVWSTPGLVRRRVRRRGRCVRCGYELLAGVAVCPECGDISKRA